MTGQPVGSSLHFLGVPVLGVPPHALFARNPPHDRVSPVDSLQLRSSVARAPPHAPPEPTP